MAFADDFVACLAAANPALTVPAVAVPDHDTLGQGLDKISAYIATLDEATATALDEVTADFPAKAGLGEQIAPEIADLLAAFDQIPAELPISGMLDACNNCLGAEPAQPT